MTCGLIYLEIGSSEVTEFLLSKGISVDIDLGHGTPLYSATNRGEYKTMKVLLDHHANVCVLTFLPYFVPKFKI